MEEEKKRSFRVRQIWALRLIAQVSFWSVAWDGEGIKDSAVSGACAQLRECSYPCVWMDDHDIQLH